MESTDKTQKKKNKKKNSEKKKEWPRTHITTLALYHRNMADIFTHTLIHMQNINIEEQTFIANIWILYFSIKTQQ